MRAPRTRLGWLCARLLGFERQRAADLLHHRPARRQMVYGPWEDVPTRRHREPDSASLSSFCSLSAQVFCTGLFLLFVWPCPTMLLKRDEQYQPLSRARAGQADHVCFMQGPFGARRISTTTIPKPPLILQNASPDEGRLSELFLASPVHYAAGPHRNNNVRFGRQCTSRSRVPATAR